jgi:hypothetical protein
MMDNQNPNKEFQAPQWVQDESATEGLSAKQRKLLTAVLFVALPFCLWAGWFEFGRAQSGNWRAWVYTFEWPFFGGVAVYLYSRIMKGDIPKISRPDFAALAKEFDEEEKSKLDPPTQT